MSLYKTKCSLPAFPVAIQGNVGLRLRPRWIGGGGTMKHGRKRSDGWIRANALFNLMRLIIITLFKLYDVE